MATACLLPLRLAYAALVRRRPTACALSLQRVGARSLSAAASMPPPATARPRIKLRRVRTWSEFAPYVSEITVKCDPAIDGAIGCVELWRQARGLAIRDKFPKYTATLTEVEDGSAASVVVKYVDGRVQRLPAAHLALLDIFDGMAEFTEALQVKEEMDELEKG